MEKRLVKNGVHGYYLTVNDKIYGVINNSDSKLQKLSLKNCEAIANGYDLDELAHHNSLSYTWLEFDEKDKALMSKYSIEGFKAGFQKALEILGDKKFSEKDILIIRNKFVDILPIGDVSTWDMIKASKDFISWFDNYIQSLQQTEWDIEIELECCSNYSSCNWNCEHGPKPKLDVDGCLILKRK